MQINKEQIIMMVRKGQLARMLNVPWPTVKYYTKVGLFPIASKTPHGQHLYDFNLIRERYDRIKELKRNRHTIEEIIERLQLEAIVEEAR